GIYRATLGYGLAYATVLPGQPTPVIRPYSPRKFVAVYDDPEADEWPRFGLAVSPGSALDDGGRVREVARLRLLDDTNVYHFEAPPHGGLPRLDWKSTRLNSSHVKISYAVFCLKKNTHTRTMSRV